MDDRTLLVAGATLAAALVGGLASTLGGYLSQRSIETRKVRALLKRDLVPEARSSARMTRWGHEAESFGIPRIQLLAKLISEVVTVACTASRRDGKRAAKLVPIIDEVLDQDERLADAQVERGRTRPADTYTEELKAQTDEVLTRAIAELDSYAKWLGKRLGAPAPPYDPERRGD